jgi:competence protein ComEC
MIERFGAKLKSEVLVVGHHGSKTSSSAEFLNAVHPKVALISSGYRNRYQHPHREVLERLNQLGVEYFNTADGGELHLNFPNRAGNSLQIRQDREAQKVWWRR